jgi:DNA-binding transcriptional LysR family regulator
MEIYQVRYFLSVARTLNFTRAAEECDVAQPSLSRAIKHLEAELGSDLFRRERPQAILTELGQRMLPILTRCYESANSARALAAAVKTGQGAALRLALSPTIGLALVLPHICELGRIFDGLTFIVRRGSAAETLKFLRTGDADVAIAAAKDSDSSSLRSWLLFEEGFLLSCSRAHRLANRASVTATDLQAEQFVLPRHSEHAESLVELLTESKVSLGRCHEAYSDDDLMSLVAEGAGVAIVPRSLRAADRTTSMPLEGLDLRRTVYAFSVEGRPSTAAASTFTNLLRATDWRARAAA